MRDAAELVRESADLPSVPAPSPRERVLGTAIEPESGTLVLEMLRILLDGTPVALDAAPPELLPSELVTHVAESDYRVVCIADLPPGAPSRARYLAKRLRAARPEVKLLVGRWGPEELQEESANETLRRAGADHVGTTLDETAAELHRLAGTAGPSEAEARPVQARA